MSVISFLAVNEENLKQALLVRVCGAKRMNGPEKVFHSNLPIFTTG
jgi:hypothetical protein